MAARRKKRRALGSAPDVHKRQAGEEAARAKGFAKSALRDAQNGQCDNALYLLGQASHALGGSFMSILSLHGKDRAYHDSSYNGAAQDLEKARTAFAERCMLSRK